MRIYAVFHGILMCIVSRWVWREARKINDRAGMVFAVIAGLLFGILVPVLAWLNHW